MFELSKFIYKSFQKPQPPVTNILAILFEIKFFMNIVKFS